MEKETVMDAATEARLLKLLDRQDIMDVLVRYCRSMDRFDREGLLSCYHPDAIDDHGAFVGTAAEFFEYYKPWHAKYNTGHHHSISNTSMEMDGATAHTETYWLFESMNADGSMSLHGGRYIDRFEKRDGVWKIAARACITEWHGKLGEVEIDPGYAKVIAGSGISARDRTDRSYERPLLLTRPNQQMPF
jgi:ketosteroid isomerase-like protein